LVLLRLFAPARVGFWFYVIKTFGNQIKHKWRMHRVFVLGVPEEFEIGFYLE